MRWGIAGLGALRGYSAGAGVETPVTGRHLEQST